MYKKIISRLYQFLTFQNATYLSIFSEGMRRIVFLMSLLLPIVSAVILAKYSSDGSEITILGVSVYFLFHFILLIIIWVREGIGNVKPGGNALKTLVNCTLLISTPIIGVIFIVIVVDNNRNILSEEFTLTNNTPKHFKVNEHYIEEIYTMYNEVNIRKITLKELKFGLSNYKGRVSLYEKLKRGDKIHSNFTDFENKLFTDVNVLFAKQVYKELKLIEKATFDEFMKDLYDSAPDYKFVNFLCEEFGHNSKISCSEFKSNIYTNFR